MEEILALLKIVFEGGQLPINGDYILEIPSGNSSNYKLNIEVI